MKFRLFSILSISFILAFPPATAEDSPLERLDTWGRNRGWEAVGLLNIAGHATCTGAMIRPDLVLTAAHCLFDPAGEKVDPREIEFRAGWRDGKAIARRTGKAAVVHPEYDGNGGLTGEQIRNDLALLQLADPILSTHADPFVAGKGARLGQTVSVVSYGQGRNDAASRQRSCDILESDRGVIAMTCDVVPGSSGAPVFAVRDGRPRIVSVVSALGMAEGKQVSFGMDIEKPLAKLLADFRSGSGVFPVASAPGARRLTVGGDRKAGGARFIRP